MMMTGSYHHTPAILDDYRRRARWRRRLRMAMRIRKMVLRKAMAVFLVGMIWVVAAAGLCIALVWGMG